MATLPFLSENVKATYRYDTLLHQNERIIREALSSAFP
jgi:hypothetical protein